MKILAFTDLHLSLISFKKLKEKVAKHNPDILVCAGDVSILEQDLDYILKKLSSLKKKIIIVNGNHESESVMRKLCSNYPNLIFIHQKGYRHENCLFLGYGGSGFAMIEPNFKPVGNKFLKLIKNNKNCKIVLITHAPPFNTKVDLIVSTHCGNKTLRNFAARNKVDLYICGHLHENFGKEDNINKTLVLNPGPDGRIIDI
jgi:uncharacterized protein